MRTAKYRDRLSNCLKATVIFIAVVFSLDNCAYAQYYDFKHYNIENGLIQSQVMKIYQDENNYLWFGTQSGVSRFNGVDFVNYSKINSLKGDLVTSMIQVNGQIWLRTDAGISLLKPSRIENYPMDAVTLSQGKYFTDRGHGVLWLVNHSKLYQFSNEKLTPINITDSPDERIQSLSKGVDGKIYISVAGQGVFIAAANNFQKIIPFSGEFKDIVVSKVLQDQSMPKRFYLLSPVKLFVADKGIISHYRNSMLDTVKGNLFSLEQDKEGQLWVGASKGAYYLKNNAPIHFTTQNGFSDNVVNDIYRDHQDNIWLGTNGDGFYKFQGFNFKSYNKLGSTPLQMVMSIGKDNQNKVWLGTNGDGLINFQEGRSGRVYVPSTDPLSRYVICLYNKPGQPMLVGTYGGLWSYDGRHNFIHINDGLHLPKDVNSTLYDGDNNIWLASGSGCFFYQKDKPVENLLKQPISTLTNIGKDSIIAGTSDGLTLFKKKKIDTAFHVSELSGYTVISLIRYKNLLIGGTSGNGLFIVDLYNLNCKKYNTLSGNIPSNDVYGLMPDNDGFIWAATGKGIVKFTVDEHTLNINTHNEVVPNPILEYDQNALLNFDNKIWAGSTKGLFVFGSEDSQKAGKTRPVINIESIKVIDQVDNKNKDYINAPFGNIPDKLTLKYKHDHIVISYKGIYYSDPEGILYQYRLKGFDNKFSPQSKLNYVEFSALPPGTYTFEVRAIASTGLVSETRSVQIEIVPGFFQTFYFYFLVLFVLVGIALLIQYFLTQRKNRQRLLLEAVKTQEQVKIRKQTAEDFHDDIGNKLTRIVILADILNRKSKQQDEEQSQIVSQIRENANRLFTGAKDILWALDPHSDNLFEVLDHIKYFAVDIFNNTEVTVIFNDFEVERDLKLPVEYSRNISMIFKEVLYNILKHANATQVVLTTIATEENIKLVIFDNGQGFDLSTEKDGKGLKNMQTRAKRINGTVEMTSIMGEGTRVSLTINKTRLYTNN